MARPDGIIIAIDGPAGSGKSSTAKAVAAELGYRHLDSGAFYRGITFAALQEGIPTERWDDLSARALAGLGIAAVPETTGYRITRHGADIAAEIRAPEVNANVSRMAAVPAVRAWLLDSLRTAGARGGLVADGRDIGTVVFPDAELKFFLVCAPEERAYRRLLEQGVADPDPAQIRAEAERLVARDTLDSSRATAPLLRAPDAVLLDTTALAFPVQVRTITRLARARASA